VWTYISENTIYLKTKNITLTKTYSYSSIPNDPRTVCYFDKDNKTSVITSPRYSRSHNKEIILKESDEFLVFAEYSRSRGFNITPKWKFKNECFFSFYRIRKEKTNDKPLITKTELLGTIETNSYGAWNSGDYPPHHISISPDGKFVIMSARGANSYSLGKFRNKEVLLIWEIGNNVIEKDIVDWKGNKIPIIIKTDEELEKE
jgi:hypothetical protein